MSGDKVFLDTNIFIYMYASSEPQKKEACLTLIDTCSCLTSTQAINEISNVLTKKIQTPTEDIRRILDDIWVVCEVKQIQRQTVFGALRLKERYGFSYYDCLMLASALENGCTKLYSEDMNDGQVIDENLKIVNPFTNTRIEHS